METVVELQLACKEAGYIQDLVETAAKMEGTVRSAGTHAAGVVISDKPLVEYIPLHRPTNDSENSPVKVVTQYRNEHSGFIGNVEGRLPGACHINNHGESLCHDRATPG